MSPSIAAPSLAIVLMEAVSPAEDLYHFAFLSGLSLIRVAAIAYLIGWVVRFNLLAYVVAFWAGELIPLGWAYMQSSVAFYQANGAAMLILGIAPLALPLIASLKARRGPSLQAGA